MANISLYVSGQTEQSDITEFFQKGLMNAGENPIAFFDGVFYESHQERVGNIAFQDYLIYTDKAVYLWARGSAKDFLDRFDLGTVSVNSRNKDHDFATLNLKIRREDKDPVYVIFDMVELREAEQISKLHTVIESIIEEHLGLNFRKNLPDEVADEVLRAARSVCIPQIITLRLAAPDPAQQESHIGYGQDLLEQYKANMGYPPSERAQQPGMPPSGASHGQEHGQGGFSPADALKGLENILPTDPASLKRVVESLKDLVGDAPFKLRDQLRSDLQHVPGMLSAITELLTSISDNPQAERFIMNIVKTAVRNDGMIGSVSKLMKLSSSFGGSPKKNAQKSSSSSGSSRDSSRPDRRDPFDDDEATGQRKKIKISSEDGATRNDDCFGREASSGKVTTVSSASGMKSARSFADLDDDDAMPKRKSISIQTLDENQPAIVRHMLHIDDSVQENAAPDRVAPKLSGENGAGTEKKKISIVPEEGKKEGKSPEQPVAKDMPDPDEIAAAFAAIHLPDEDDG
ncbi:hypothetical protein [Chlorobium sp. KB01]|uniref:hypothetical protein n=1 Tax=Chlorobium sp. KB01 TaxID=1917528 RepID=UPI000976C8FA|nr:hypothetical protein [Chlorobium sp. KB01]